MSTNQKYALITGASSGIGFELAKLFAQDKYNLVLVALEDDLLSQKATTLKQQYGVEVETIVKDLFKREAPFEVYEEVKAKGIQIDVLVNNAGQGQYGLFAETDINRELDIIQLNIGATIILVKCYLPEMLARKEGKILNLSSIAGKTPGPYQSVYHGTKAFVQSFTESLRSENKDTGVTFTALLPGKTDTDFFNKAQMENSKMMEQSGSDPEEVAKDGYKALMAGDDMVISGLKNKVLVGISNITPDHLVADMMKKQQEPKED